MRSDVSFVSLHDASTSWEDPNAISIGYFAKNGTVRLDAKTIEEIKMMALETGENVRLSMHQSPEADFHEMIIFQHRDKYYRPKKHVDKAKSFHMIEGEMAVFVFEDDGSVRDACILDGQNSKIYRVDANLYHTDLPLTDFVIHHESTLGPYLFNSDRIFAPWSPDGKDTDTYLKYRDHLVSILEQQTGLQTGQ